MKLTLAFLLVVCGVLAGCGASKPSAQQIETARDRSIKKDNPRAKATITELTPSDRYIGVDFQFTDFSFTDEQGAKQTLPSGKGLADFWLQDGKWKFDKLRPVLSSAPATWRLPEGSPAIRLVPSAGNVIQALVLKVASLEKAKKFLAEHELLGTSKKQQVRVEPSKVQGLDICFTE